MKRMIEYIDGYISEDMPQQLMKCKRCKAEFAILRNAGFYKTVCFCPYCGQQSIKSKSHIDYDKETDGFIKVVVTKCLIGD